MKFYWFIAAFLIFFERQEIKEFGCSFEALLIPYCFRFKFWCFLLVLLASKDPSPLYKCIDKNLETLFLLSALKMLIKSATSYQAEIKCLEEA